MHGAGDDHERLQAIVGRRVGASCAARKLFFFSQQTRTRSRLLRMMCVRWPTAVPPSPGYCMSTDAFNSPSAFCQNVRPHRTLAVLRLQFTRRGEGVGRAEKWGGRSKVGGTCEWEGGGGRIHFRVFCAPVIF